jgi:hypothetical protein
MGGGNKKKLMGGGNKKKLKGGGKKKGRWQYLHVISSREVLDPPGMVEALTSRL